MEIDKLQCCETGCSGAVVKAQFLEKEQYLGKDGYMMMMDKTLRKAPLARIMVDTPFYKGDIQALVYLVWYMLLPDSIYGLIIGNIPLARPPDKPDPMWTVASCKAQKEDEFMNESVNIYNINFSNFISKSENYADDFIMDLSDEYTALIFRKKVQHQFLTKFPRSRITFDYLNYLTDVHAPGKAN